MADKVKDQWLIRAIETSLNRVQNSEIVNTGQLGAITEPKFFDRVQSALQSPKPEKAA